MSENTRYLIVPQIDLDGDALTSVLDSSGDRQEQGATVTQPVAPASGSLPGGDIRLTLSGTPDEGFHDSNTVRVTLPAPINQGRFGWWRDGDVDIQMRQSPRIIGRRQDILEYNETATSLPYISKPRALPLNSGPLLCGWMQMSASPANGGVGHVISLATMQVDGEWGAVDTPAELTYDSALFFGIYGWDMVQYPDTDEVVLCRLENDNSGTPRAMVCSVSQDDGATWIERRRLFFGYDLTITDGAITDSSKVLDIALHVLDNGRLVAVIVTEEGTWSLISDDRGRTWYVGALIEDWSGDAPATTYGGSVSSTRQIDGAGLFVVSHMHSLRGAVGEVWATYNGIAWSVALGGFENGIGDSGVTAATIVSRPDGYIQIYSAQHEVSVANKDWLYTITSKKRVLDFNPTTNSDLWETSEAQRAFHTIEGTAANPINSSPIFQGFEWVDATVWRGQIVLLASAHWMDPGFLSSGLQLYRLNHWQPLQERLNTVSSPSRGLTYNRTWEPYARYSYFGWTGVGAGTDAVADVAGGSPGGTAGGYRTFITTANARYYEDTTLPDADTGYGGALRFVMWPQSGGDTTTSQIACIYALTSGGVGFSVGFRFKQTGAVAELVVHDNKAAADLGSVSFTNPSSTYQSGWVEVLAYTSSGGDLTVFARHFDPTLDVDWDDTYEVVVSAQSLTTGSQTEGVWFGNLVSGTAESRWKTVQLQRVNGGSPTLRLNGASFVDEDLYGTLRDVGTDDKIHDSGLENYPRTAFITAEPQYLTGGVSASFRGEATLTGNYDYETGYDYAGRNMLEGPTVQEWRSLESTSGEVDDITVTLDAGSALEFKPTGLAVFGRNFSSMRVQMGDDLATWPVDMVLGTPNDLLTCDRYTHIWSTDSTDFTTAVSGRQVLAVANSGTFQGPWRAHQFKSQETGEKYYALIKDSTGTDIQKRKVYRILDNDEGMLTLYGNPGDDGFTSSIEMDIFSDRFAVFLGRRHSVTNTTYRYIRLTFYGCNHRDDDERFHRVGRVMLGFAHNLSKPMFDWGWAYGQDSGQNISEAANGVRYSNRLSPPRRKFSCSYRLLRANEEATSTNESPTSGYATPDLPWYVGGGGHPKTWGHVVDLLRKLELDGERCALVWDGDRAQDYGPTSATVQTSTAELLMVRVTDVTDMQHVGYEGKDKNMADGVHCRPAPMMTGSFAFEEEF